MDNYTINDYHRRQSGRVMGVARPPGFGAESVVWEGVVGSPRNIISCNEWYRNKR